MTTLRDIVVVLDESASSEMRLTVAVGLAQQHGAHLTGVSALDLLLPARPAARPHDNPLMYTLPASKLMNLGAVLPHDYSAADTLAAEAAERIEAAFRERPRIYRPAQRLAGGKRQSKRDGGVPGAAR